MTVLTEITSFISTLTPLQIGIIGGGLSVLVLIVWVVRLEIKLRRLLVGKGSKTLDDSISTLHFNLEEINRFRKELEQYLAQIEKRIARSVASIETIRFNPFKGDGSGGNQSFATALLNEHGTGVVLSSLYSRDRVSVFSKPILKGKSEYELSEEERQVLKRAWEAVRVRE